LYGYCGVFLFGVDGDCFVGDGVGGLCVVEVGWCWEWLDVYFVEGEDVVE